MSVEDIDGALTHLAGIRGAGSAARRAAALRDLFARATAAEQQFLLRLLTGELRQGALAGVMIDAIAAAAQLPVTAVRRAAMYSENLARVVARQRCWRAARHWSNFSSSCSSPVAPMLAQTAADVDEALHQLPGRGGIRVEDGRRAHPGAQSSRDEVRIYTRALNEVTEAVPEIVEAVARLRRAQPDPRRRGHRFRRRRPTAPLPGHDAPFRPQACGVSELRAELPIRAFFFDCLRVEARALADRPDTRALRGSRGGRPAAMRMPRLVTASAAGPPAFYDAALAAGHEGVMAKALDAPYEAGNRGASWLKIKRAHTLDLVVLAAEWGHGRRRGKLSNLHLGALDPATGEYVMLGKTFKGLTDAMLEWQTARTAGARDAAATRSRSTCGRSWWSRSPSAICRRARAMPAAWRLRLARVKRYRDDKRAEEADTWSRCDDLRCASGAPPRPHA